MQEPQASDKFDDRYQPPEEPDKKEEAGAVDYETLASQLGWRPKDEFKGDPNAWKSAEEYVKHGERTLPIMRDNIKRMSSELTTATGRITQLQQTVENLAKHFKDQTTRAVEQERKKFETKLKQIRADKRKAAAEGDTSAYTELELEEDDLRASQPKEELKEDKDKKQDAPQPSPEFQDWITSNQWYSPDSEEYDENMAITAEAIGKSYLQRHPRAIKGMFKEIDKRIKQLYPDKFENPERKKAASVDSSNKSDKVSSDKRGYNDLPPEAKQACDELCKEIKGFTKEEYLKNYVWET